MKHVLIINITRMGDLIQMIPLVARLKDEWPGVAVDVIVDREFAHVAHLIPGIRHVLTYDFQDLMDESRVCVRDVVSMYQDLATWANPLLQHSYDRVINLTFNRRSAFLVKFFGCSDERGMTTAGDGSFLVKNPWMQYFLDFHMYRQINRFNIVDLFALGGSGPGKFHPIQLNVSEDLRQWARRFLRNAGAPDRWVAVQVGASDPMKAWRPEYFGELMHHLGNQTHIGYVLIGTKKEEPVVREAMHVCQQKGGQSIFCDAAGQTSVPELVGLLSECQLMVTNDTGPMHLAVGSGTPVLNVSVGHVDFWETGPYGPGHWVVQPDIVCGPCGFDKVCPHHACKDQIVPHEIASLCRYLLGGESLSNFSPSIRVYEGTVDADQLGSFRLRAGVEAPDLVWYAAFWRRQWYEWFTGLPSRCPEPRDSFPHSDVHDAMWDQLSTQLDSLCQLADTVVRLCQQHPVAVQALKQAHSQLKQQILIVKESAQQSLVFGPPVMASIRDTFNLEEQSLSGMAAEYSQVFQNLQRRVRIISQQITHYSSQHSRRNHYVGAIG